MIQLSIGHLKFTHFGSVFTIQVVQSEYSLILSKAVIKLSSGQE